MDESYAYLGADEPMVYMFDKLTGDYKNTVVLQHEP
jgi:hypothetical protein